jgi:hypothetical protein
MLWTSKIEKKVIFAGMRQPAVLEEKECPIPLKRSN